MRPGGWTAAAVAAVLSAVVPGLLSLGHGDLGLDRAVAPTTALADRDVPLAAAAGDATAIAPPPAELTGALAPSVPAPPTYRSTGGPGEVFSLSVGVDDYPGSSADLRWAGADAVAVDEALARFGVPGSNRVLLRDGQARRGQLVGAIEALVAQAGPGTKAVLAFAGHVRKLDRDTEAMVTADGELLTDVELAELLAPARADQIWIVLATCYAGGFTEVLAPGRILTGAADAWSLAYESSAVGGSYLVHHLVREGWLQDRAGPTVQDAFAYAVAATRGSPDRTPVQIDQAGGPMWFGPVGAASPSAAPAAPTPSGDPGAGGSSPPPPPPSSPPPPSADDDEPGSCSLLVLCR